MPKNHTLLGPRICFDVRKSSEPKSKGEENQPYNPNPDSPNVNCVSVTKDCAKITVKMKVMQIFDVNKESLIGLTLNPNHLNLNVSHIRG